LIGLAMLVAATAATPQELNEVDTALFELCPKVLDGSITLNDAAQVIGAGYHLMEPLQLKRAMPRIEKTAGNIRIQIAGWVPGDTPSCMVTMGGIDASSLFDAALATSQAHGYSGPPPKPLQGVSRYVQLRSNTNVHPLDLGFLLAAEVQWFSKEPAILAVMTEAKK